MGGRGLLMYRRLNFLVLALLAALLALPAPTRAAGPSYVVSTGGSVESSAIEPSQEARLTPSSNAGPSEWGSSVAVSGDTAVVGSACCGGTDLHGLAEVFVRDGDTWSWQATLSASDTPPGAQDLFGWSVAIEGDVAIIGAPGFAREAAYVFRRTGVTWVEEAKLTATPRDPYNFFGGAVEISGDTVIVGAPGMGSQGAFVFVDGTTGWAQQASLQPTGYSYGYAVAVEGDVAVVGAGGSREAHVYTRSGTTWSHDATLNEDWYLFGHAVAIDDGHIAIGAPNTWNGNGAVFVFSGSGSSWTQTAMLALSDSPVAEAPGQGISDSFGVSLDLDGDSLVVGATDQPSVCEGSAYVYVRYGTAWTEVAGFGPEDPAPDCGSIVGFGDDVAIQADTVVVGAPGEENGVPGVWGAAYVFHVDVPVDVDIDIKPGSDTNPINVKNGNGVVPVALLGSAEFDVHVVDVASLRFGATGDEAAPAHNLARSGTVRRHLEDVDRDGFTDLVSHYRVGETGLQPGDTSACLTGETNDGTRFRGCDSVQIIGPPMSPPMSPPERMPGPQAGPLASMLSTPMGLTGTATAIAALLLFGSIRSARALRGVDGSDHGSRRL